MHVLLQICPSLILSLALLLMLFQYGSIVYSWVDWQEVLHTIISIIDIIACSNIQKLLLTNTINIVNPPLSPKQVRDHYEDGDDRLYIVKAFVIFVYRSVTIQQDYDSNLLSSATVWSWDPALDRTAIVSLYYSHRRPRKWPRWLFLCQNILDFLNEDLFK